VGAFLNKKFNSPSHSILQKEDSILDSNVKIKNPIEKIDQRGFRTQSVMNHEDHKHTSRLLNVIEVGQLPDAAKLIEKRYPS
jgi:hypothetical protein